MDKSIFTGIFPAVAALLGVALSEFFGRWKRREQFKGVLFNKKIEIYAALVGKTCDIAHHLYFAVDDKAVADSLPEIAKDFEFFISGNIMYLTHRVTDIASHFVAVAVDGEMDLDAKKTELGAIHRLLRDQCQKELGLKTLEKDLERMR